jgi:hypothetical protein
MSGIYADRQIQITNDEEACSENLRISGPTTGRSRIYSWERKECAAINGLIEFYCLRHVSNNQVFILKKTC